MSIKMPRNINLFHFRRWIMAMSLCTLTLTLPASTLDKFFANIAQKTLQTDFTIALTENASQPLFYVGQITMQEEYFHAYFLDTEAAYDGHTLYIYSEATDELTLSNPTDEELLGLNPFLFAKSLKENCTLSEKQIPNSSQTKIILTPKDQSAGINRFILLLQLSDNQADYLPISIEIHEKEKQTHISFQQTQYTTDTPSFSLDYPNAYLNDLRE